MEDDKNSTPKENTNKKNPESYYEVKAQEHYQYGRRFRNLAVFSGIIIILLLIGLVVVGVMKRGDGTEACSSGLNVDLSEPEDPLYSMI